MNIDELFFPLNIRSFPLLSFSVSKRLSRLLYLTSAYVVYCSILEIQNTVYLVFVWNRDNFLFFFFGFFAVIFPCALLRDVALYIPLSPKKRGQRGWEREVIVCCWRNACIVYALYCVCVQATSTWTRGSTWKENKVRGSVREGVCVFLPKEQYFRRCSRW